MRTIAPLLLRSAAETALRKSKGGGQIDVEDAMPFPERELSDRLVARDSRIGHDAVEPSECFERRGHGPFRRLLLRHVAFEDDRAPALGKPAGKTRAGEIDRGDAPSRLQQRTRDR